LFFRADGTLTRIAVETGRPIRDSKIIEKLFREKLDALRDPLDPGFGFDLIRLLASHAEPLSVEEVVLSANDNEKTEIAFLIDRLSARFGFHRVLAFRPNDTHVPEAAWIICPAQHALPAKLAWQIIRGPMEAPCRPLRLFASFEPIEILCRELEEAPSHIYWRCTLRALKQIEGPERIAMEWWRHPHPQTTRDYFRAEDEQGRRFWLCQNGIRERDIAMPRWFMHGTFA
jgi:protein ImuB